MSPILSVLMTSYNREQYIGEAIESVLDSTYRNWELIIVDDCSKDNTVSIAESYAAKDSRIKIYINEQNLGDYPNRNQAASYATGEFIMYVDSDDKILADGFERCIDAMQKFPQANFGMQLHGKESSPFYWDSKQAIEQHFFSQPFLMIGPGGTIIRRNYFESIGRYPVLYGPANDMYFNLKASVSGGVLLLPFIFNFYRIHDGQEFNNKYSYLYNNFNYLKDALTNLNLPLSSRQKNWVLNKCRRRFFINIIQYLYKSKHIGSSINACKLANFGIIDFWKAIFHSEL